MLWRWVDRATRWQITNRYSINQQSIANRWKYQSIKLPIDRLKPIDPVKPIDRIKLIDDQSIIKILKKARLPIDYRKQSITNPSIGHRLVIDWKKLLIVSSGRAWDQNKRPGKYHSKMALKSSCTALGLRFFEFRHLGDNFSARNLVRIISIK